MRIFLAATIILLVLALPICAKPESVETGPYKVNFDLGIKEPYEIEVYPGIPKETYAGASYTEYNIIINNTAPPKEGFNVDKYAQIIISHYEDPFTLNKEEFKKVYDQWKSYVTIYDRAIDNKDGLLVVTSLFGFNKFSFVYQMDPQNVVGADSTYPWEEGTMGLIKSIHVEKIK